MSFFFLRDRGDAAPRNVGAVLDGSHFEYAIS